MELPSSSALSDRSGYTNWSEFLTGKPKEGFLSVAETKEVVKLQKIINFEDYMKRAAQFGLQSYRTITSRSDWISWDDLFDRQKPTLLDYQLVVQKAGIKTSREYKKRAKDLGLPT